MEPDLVGCFHALFYFQNREIETTDQYTYLGFIFVPSGKKKVGIWNLLQKSKKAWFAIQKMLFKSKGKTVNSCIKQKGFLMMKLKNFTSLCVGKFWV